MSSDENNSDSGDEQLNHINEITEMFRDERDNKSSPAENVLEERYVSDKNNIPWVEKHRPRKLDDIVQQNEVIKVLKNTIKTGDLPHMLFFGPPGTGKTSTILALAMQLFGPNIIHDRVIELNASDDRGISTVRNKIITFAKIAVGSKDKKYPCPDFKLVILDEADAMTPEAQAALRKVMETNSGITRFCFICNFINQIIDPISSRCMKFRFKPINDDAILEKLKLIATAEEMKIDDECIKTITKISRGDVRRSIMTLQNLKYVINCKGSITPDDIIKITGGIELSKFDKFWKICVTENVLDVRKLALSIKRDGFPVGNILVYIDSCLLENKIDHVKKLSDTQKSHISLKICNADKQLIEGSSEYLQLLDVLLYINMIVKAKE